MTVKKIAHGMQYHKLQNSNEINASRLKTPLWVFQQIFVYCIWMYGYSKLQTVAAVYEAQTMIELWVEGNYVGCYDVGAQNYIHKTSSKVQARFLMMYSQSWLISSESNIKRHKELKLEEWLWRVDVLLSEDHNYIL